LKKHKDFFSELSDFAPWREENPIPFNVDSKVGARIGSLNPQGGTMALENQTLGQSMVRLFMGYIPTRVIYVAAKLELTDNIGSDGASAHDLARKMNVDAAALYRVMRVLAGLGVLRQDDNDRFFVTPFGETLRKDSPHSVRDYAIYSHEIVYDAFKDITDCVRSGKPAIDDFFALLRANPEKEAVFHAGMSKRSRSETAAILEAYKFSKPQTVVDVGGGNGGFLSAITASCDQVSGVLVDQPSAIEAARAGRGGPLTRCQLVAQDFFEGVPPGGDTYILKRILFDWTDEEALRILKNCRRAMNGEARLLIIEPLIGPPNEQCSAHLYDMTFLVILHGRLRTADEYSALLGRAGFRLQRVVPTESDVAILKATVV
jgi:ubiquinone/menaquinone biosynthesis C-methylase UbiE